VTNALYNTHTHIHTHMQCTQNEVIGSVVPSEAYSFYKSIIEPHVQSGVMGAFEVRD